MENSLQNLRKTFENRLSGLLGAGECNAVFREAARHIMNMQPHEWRMNQDMELSPDQIRAWDSLMADLETGKPLQYIIGETEFFGLNLKVNEHTLIPRPETEELVEMILTARGNAEQLTVLDIGTGTGCIALALKANRPNWKVTGIDVSKQAVETAVQNARDLRIDAAFHTAGIEQFRSDHRFDLIVSNPPYIDTSEKEALQKQVVEHEPHEALFAPENDPVYFYRVIAQKSNELLRPGGRLYFEIHHQNAEKVMEALTENGFIQVEKKTDMSRNDRMVTALKNNRK